MNNATQRPQWQDEDVIGHPGQHLTPEEIAHLVALANGNTPSAITQMHGTSRGAQQDLESSLKAKLGALSKPHLITRAFVLSVIAPRALCLLLAALSINASPGDITMTRTPRPSRTPVTSSRNVRSHSHADAYALPVLRQQAA
jgi:DNA-binding CsgD family transcriptional regulator